MRTAAQNADSETAEGIGVAAGEVARELRCKAAAHQGSAAVADVTGRELFGSQREHSGFWESWVGQKSSSVRAGAGVDCSAGAEDTLHQVRTADAGSFGRQAGSAIEPGDQTARPL